ncbi:hypothetical protein TSOC_004564 [Tetrabaena socialis]|uniref:Uncharacterized protein n=1 Tax=Tetrabaena socialis TaxID=47790 RepID=A0A2J8A8L5_9CHLO|nr:hypothetical protein TSOC_004564 [Tetrabaena socialis]|eukprot:PNH08858.1 hypothetical protein TSOC_004564 [Tetrabaena socialis]
MNPGDVPPPADTPGAPADPPPTRIEYNVIAEKMAGVWPTALAISAGLAALVCVRVSAPARVGIAAISPSILNVLPGIFNVLLGEGKP